MAEAQKLMDQLNDLMENMQVTQGDGSGQRAADPGQQAMQDLAETLRDQQDLSDEAFREMLQGAVQRHGPARPGSAAGPGQGSRGRAQQQGQNGQGQQQGQPGQGQASKARRPRPATAEVSNGQAERARAERSGRGSGQSLAERQQALRDELSRQRGNLPGLPGEAGDAARQALDRAEGAMDQAERALRDGDMAEAIDRQAEAMDALRDGMRAIGEALAQNHGQEPGRAMRTATRPVRSSRAAATHSGGNWAAPAQYGTDENMLQGEDVYRRAEELAGRRSGAGLPNRSRPQVERDYLDRLLDRF